MASESNETEAARKQREFDAEALREKYRGRARQAAARRTASRSTAR